MNLQKINPLLSRGYVINMTNPHIVFFTKSLDLINLKEVGSNIEKYHAFKEGTNVEIAEIASKSSIKLKFWERGVGETLSCGSGILAASYASFKYKKCNKTMKIILPLGTVKVNINKKELNIIGKADVSFLGEYNYD